MKLYFLVLLIEFDWGFGYFLTEKFVVLLALEELKILFIFLLSVMNQKGQMFRIFI